MIWRQPKWNRRRSSSTAATPSPAANASPIAAATSTPSGESAVAPAVSRPGSHASRNDSAASTHARVVHESRGPVAMASGTAAAATMPHGGSPAPARPVWKCRIVANDSDARGCAPKVAASAPMREIDQGASSTALAPKATTALPTARPARCAPPANGIARQYASASAGMRKSAGGQTEPAIAVTNATEHRTCTRLRFPSRSPMGGVVVASSSPLPVMRTNAPSTYGASANKTSGPSSPPQIALRAIGIGGVGRGRRDPRQRRRREGPQEPVRAEGAEAEAPHRRAKTAPCRNDRTARHRRTTSARRAVWPASAAPMIVVRQAPLKVDHASPTPGQAWNEPTSGTCPKSSERDPNNTSSVSPIANSAGNWRARCAASSMRTRVIEETSASRSPA